MSSFLTYWSTAEGTRVAIFHVFIALFIWRHLDMFRYLSPISRFAISAYFGVSTFRDICWTVGDPLSRYWKPVVASCGKQKITSTHSHRRAQQVWHSLMITHVAAAVALVASWHDASWIQGGRYRGLGGPRSACTAADMLHYRISRLGVPSLTFPFTWARHRSSTAM